MNVAEEVIQAFEQDELLSHLTLSLPSSSLKNNNDLKSFIKQLQQSQTSTKPLQLGKERVELAIEQTIQQNQSQVLDRLLQTQAMEQEIQFVKNEVLELQNLSNRIQTLIIQPYQTIKSRVKQLQHMWSATESLRKLNLFFRLLNRLQNSTAPSTPSTTVLSISTPTNSFTHKQSVELDIVKASLSLLELEEIISTKELKGIEAYDMEESWVLQVSQLIRTKASNVLFQGLKNQNLNDIVNSLSVFCNLQSLPTVVKQQVLDRFAMDMKQIWRQFFEHVANDIATLQNKNANYSDGKGATLGIFQRLKTTSSLLTNLGGSNTSSTNSSSQNSPILAGDEIKISISTKLKNALDSIYQIFLQVVQLERALQKKVDPNTQTVLENLVIQSGEKSIVNQFWDRLTQTSAEEFDSISSNQNMKSIRALLVEDYLNLVQVFFDFVTNLEQERVIDFLYSNEETLLHQTDASLKPHAWVRNTLKQIESLYVNKFLNNLFEKTNTLLSKNVRGTNVDASTVGLPISDVKHYTTSLTTEYNSLLNVICQIKGQDISLLVDIAKQIYKTVAFFCAEVEKVISNQKESYHIPPGSSKVFAISISKRYNASLLSAILEVEKAVRSLVQSTQKQKQILFALVDHSSLFEELIGKLNSAIDATTNLSKFILEPVFIEVKLRLLALYPLILQQNYNQEMNQQNTLFIQMLENEIKYIKHFHLSMYDNRSTCYEQVCKDLVSELTNRYCLFVSLKKSLLENGKLQLTAEMSQFEYLMSISFCSLEQCGTTTLAEFKSTRQILFTNWDTIMSGSVNSTLLLIHPVIAAHILFAKLGEIDSNFNETIASLIGMTQEEYAMQYLQTNYPTASKQILKKIKDCLQSVSQKQEIMKPQIEWLINFISQ